MSSVTYCLPGRLQQAQSRTVSAATLDQRPASASNDVSTGCTAYNLSRLVLLVFGSLTGIGPLPTLPFSCMGESRERRGAWTSQRASVSAMGIVSSYSVLQFTIQALIVLVLRCMSSCERRSITYRIFPTRLS